MDILFDSTVLLANDLQKLKSFYSDILLQPIKHDFGNCVVFGSFAIWELKSDYPITKKLGYKYSSKGNMNLELCFTCNQINEVFDKLKKLEIKFLHGIETELWGQKTIRFYDPENNLIEIGESLEGFTKRLLSEGLSIQETHKKTGIPLSQIKSWIE